MNIKECSGWCRLLWECNSANIIFSQMVININNIFCLGNRLSDYNQFNAVLYLFRRISSKHLKPDVWIGTLLKSICTLIMSDSVLSRKICCCNWNVPATVHLLKDGELRVARAAVKHKCTSWIWVRSPKKENPINIYYSSGTQ